MASSGRCGDGPAGGDFWAWRETMLAEAAARRRRAPQRLRATYSELLAAGYTAVGEFHYLGFDEAIAAAEARPRPASSWSFSTPPTAAAGSTLSPGQRVGYLAEVEALSSVGSAPASPHSVRACPNDWLIVIGRYAETVPLPLHVHACEQPREIEECLAEHDLRPIELLAETGCLGPRTTVIHATHASDTELDLLAAAGTRVCICPTTEASLGDGFAPVERLLERGIEICIGSDANVRIDPLEELRQLDGIAREKRLRGTSSTPARSSRSAAEGAAALGLAGGRRSRSISPTSSCEGSRRRT